MKSPASRLKKLGTPNKMTSPSPARRKAAEHLAEMTPQKQVVATPRSARQGSAKNYKEEEHLTVRINVYDLVWNRNDNGEAVKNAASGFENLGFGLYHSALEIWGKEISFGHSKRYKSGVFAVMPQRAQEYMPNTRFKSSIEIATLMFSRHSMDKLLNRLAAKYTSVTSSSFPLSTVIRATKACISRAQHNRTDCPNPSHLVLLLAPSPPLPSPPLPFPPPLPPSLAPSCKQDSYDVLRCNCNHFTEELCMAVCGKPIPEWINRPAKAGAAALEALNAPLKVLTPRP
jgi:hypothetical protein